MRPSPFVSSRRRSERRCLAIATLVLPVAGAFSVACSDDADRPRSSDAGLGANPDAEAGDDAASGRSCTKHPIARIASAVQFIGDRTGSAVSDNLYPVEAAILKALVDDYGRRFDPAVSIGFASFGSPASPFVAPAVMDLVQTQAITSALNTSATLGAGSDPGPVLKSSYAALLGGDASVPFAPSVAKSVVLMFDGINVPGSEALLATTQAAAAGVPTHVLYFTGGAGASSQSLLFADALAKAGGTAPAGCDAVADGGVPCAQVFNVPTTLADPKPVGALLNQILTRLSCRFTLPALAEGETLRVRYAAALSKGDGGISGSDAGASPDAADAGAASFVPHEGVELIAGDAAFGYTPVGALAVLGTEACRGAAQYSLEAEICSP